MKTKPKFVSAYRDRHGVLRWRFRRTGSPQSQTRAVFGTEDWWAWYAEACEARPKAIGQDRTKPGSIHALAVAYYSSARFLQLKPNTKHTYKGVLDRYRDAHGAKPFGRLEPRHIRQQMDDMAREMIEQGNTVAPANTMLKVLRSVMRFAMERGLISVDPTMGVRMLKHQTSGFHTWSEDEIAMFEARWPIGSRQRLGFDLLLYTAQRSDDVRQMTINQIARDRVIVRQGKTGQSVDIPQHPRLQASLAASEIGHLVLVTTQHGKPYTPKGFGNWIKDAAVKAGLPHCSAHGLRKAASRRLAEAGCTTHEIAAITGHQSLKEVERYTREVNRRGLADGAMKRIG